MNPVLLPSSGFQPIQWSGGTTRQLFIFPPEAQYKDRNFKFRISTATVETETSEFTLLPGVSRKLMVLSGQITIHHQAHYSRLLSPFDIESFEGDWQTSAVGKCTDFNLMTTGKTSGELSPINIEKGQTAEYGTKEKCDWFFLYLFMGQVKVKVKDTITSLHAGDMLVWSQADQPGFELEGLENTKLVFVEIWE